MSFVLILQPVATPRFVASPIEMSPPGPRTFSLTELEEDAVNPRVIAALREASRRLRASNIRHATIGAIAVGVYGWPRATSDVDLLIGPEAFDTAADGSSVPKVDLPEEIGGVRVDYLPIDVAGDFLLEAFDGAVVSDDVPIAPAEAVILTKLLRLAMRDQADIVELLKAGQFDLATVASYLERHAPMLSSRFEALVEQARKEQTRGT